MFDVGKEHTRSTSILISRCENKTPNDIQLDTICSYFLFDITSEILEEIDLLLILILIYFSLDKKCSSGTLDDNITKTLTPKTLSAPSTLLR